MNVQETLINWASSFSLSNVVAHTFRSIGGFIIYSLCFICDMLYKAVSEIYGLMDFINSSAIKDFIGDYYPVVKILLILSVTFLGVFLLFKKTDGATNVSQNILIIMLVIVAMPIFGSKMYALTSGGVQFAQEQYSTENSLSYNIVKSNVIDLAKVDDKFATNNGLDLKHETATKDIKNYNYITKSNWEIMQLSWATETIDPDSSKSNVFQKKLTVDKTGSVNVTELDSGWFKWDEEYYRYDIFFGTLIFTLLTAAVAFSFTAIRVARIIFEIGWNQMLAPFFAATDIWGGQRIKELLKHMISLFATLFLISAMFGMYLITLAFLASKKDDIGFVAYIMGLIAIAWLLIDGPNIIERVIGVDAGISSGYKTMATMVGGVMMAKSFGKGTANLARTATIGHKNGAGGRSGGALRMASKAGVGTYKFGKEAKENGFKDTLKERLGKNNNNDNKDSINDKNTGGHKETHYNSASARPENNNINKKANNSYKKESESVNNEIKGKNINKNQDTPINSEATKGNTQKTSVKQDNLNRSMRGKKMSKEVGVSDAYNSKIKKMREEREKKNEQ